MKTYKVSLFSPSGNGFTWSYDGVKDVEYLDDGNRALRFTDSKGKEVTSNLRYVVQEE